MRGRQRLLLPLVHNATKGAICSPLHGQNVRLYHPFPPPLVYLAVRNSSYIPILVNPFVQILALILWGGVIAVSIVGLTKLKMGLPQQLAVPNDFYLQEYFNNQSVYGEAGPPVYVVLQNVDWDNPNTNISQANVR